MMLHEQGMVVEVPDTLPWLWDQSTKSILGYDGSLDVVVDIGANTGCVSLAAAAKGAQLVLAFEPEAWAYERLVKNVIRNRLTGIILPINAAVVSGIDGHAIVPIRTLHCSADGKVFGNGGQCGLRYDADIPISNFARGMTLRHAGRLAEWLSCRNHINYLKIDIEGYEFDLLRPDGPGQAFLGSSVEFLDLEIHHLGHWPGLSDGADLFEAYGAKDCDDLPPKLIECLRGTGFMTQDPETVRHADGEQDWIQCRNRNFDDE